jgi:hypothetical protein
MGDRTQAYDIFQTPLSSGYPLPLTLPVLFFAFYSCFSSFIIEVKENYGSRSEMCRQCGQLFSNLVLYSRPRKSRDSLSYKEPSEESGLSDTDKRYRYTVYLLYFCEPFGAARYKLV